MCGLLLNNPHISIVDTYTPGYAHVDYYTCAFDNRAWPCYR
jgi:hypothetical protein